MLGRKEDRQPAVGDLTREGDVLGAQHREVDRDLFLDRADRELQHLAGSLRKRQFHGFAVVLDLLVRQRHPHHRHVVACTFHLARKSHSVPALGNLRPRRAEAEQHAPA